MYDAVQFAVFTAILTAEAAKMNEDNPLIFISYAREDSEKCNEVFRFFDNLGLNVFRDQERIRVGVNWEQEILRMAKLSSAMVFLSSKNSVEKSGMIQKELDIAWHKTQIDENFLFITVRLDDFPIKEWMNCRQYVAASDPLLFEKIVRSINENVNFRDSAIVNIGGHAFLNESLPDISYESDECSYSYNIPVFSIVGDHIAAQEINSLLRGRVAERILEMKSWMARDKFKGLPYYISIGSEEIVYLENNIGIPFGVSLYSGGAHPNHGFFALNIVRHPWSLRTLYIRPEKLEYLVDRMVEEVHGEWTYDRGMVREALLRFPFAENTILIDNGARVFFYNYSIAPYVAGPQVHDFIGDEYVDLFHSDR